MKIKKICLLALSLLTFLLIVLIIPNPVVAQSCDGAGSVCCDYVTENFACTGNGNTCLPGPNECDDGFSGSCESTGTECIGAEGGFSCRNWYLETNSCGNPGCRPGLYEYSNSGCSYTPPPPSGGYGCLAGNPNYCAWASWGTYPTASCGSGCAPVPICGDRRTDAGEDCDDGPSGSATCTSGCRTITPPNCGQVSCGTGQVCCQASDYYCYTGSSCPSGGACAKLFEWEHCTQARVPAGEGATDCLLDPVVTQNPVTGNVTFDFQCAQTHDKWSDDVQNHTSLSIIKGTWGAQPTWFLPGGSDSVTFNDPDGVKTGADYLIMPQCASYGDGNVTGTGQNASKIQNCFRTAEVVQNTTECTVTTSAGSIEEGTTLNITVRGDANYTANEPVRLFVERTDFGTITPKPDSATPSSTAPYYQVGGCDIVNGAPCEATAQISNLPVGSYKLHCDVPTSLVKCSGNPWCDYEGGTGDCTGPNPLLPNWVSCSNGDNVNVVVTPGPPPAPENLVSSCTSPGDKMTLSWNAVPGADSYLVRVDDGIDGFAAGEDNVEAVLYAGADTCGSYPNWDVCVQTTSTSIQVQIDPATFESAIWRIYPINSAGQGPYTEATLNSCIPNCTDLTGPNTIAKGASGVFEAVYSAGYPNHFAAMLAGQETSPGVFTSRATNEWTPIDKSCGLAGCTETFSWDTTNVPEGDYDIFCRTYLSSIASCRGNANYITTAGQYICRGPGITTKTVTVTPKKISVSGEIWIGQASGSTCSTIDPASTQWNGANSMSVSINPAYQGTTPTSVQTTGAYTVPNIDQQATTGTTTNVTLGGTLPTGYQFVCPASGTRAVDVSGNSVSGINFYIYDVKNPWWQASGGNIFSTNALSIATPIDTCSVASPTCEQYLVTKELFSPYLRTATRNSISAGIPLARGTISGSGGSAGYLTDRTAAATKAISLGSPALTENYAYFAYLADPTTLGKSLMTSPYIPTAIRQMSDLSGATDHNGTTIYYAPQGLYLNPTETIAITGNKKVIIYVTGDLQVLGSSLPASNYQVSTVAQGSNLIFIVSGNIIVDKSVGSPTFTSTTPNLEGIFITNGTITVQGTTDAVANPERKFVGAGSFIGHQNVSLNRNFNSTDLDANKTAPTELFIFRPDLVANWPELLKTASLSWQEVR
jgi:hypothetical protein